MGKTKSASGKNLLSYVYDKNGNTKEIKDITGKVTCDAEGLRHEIIENGNLTKFIFNKENILVELDKEDKPVTRLSRGYEVVSSEAENAKFYYHTQDEQGSTVGISNEDGYFVNSYLYDAFGNILESKEEIHNRIGYTGQQFDPVTQQYYLRARFYNPVVGRFLQEDPYRGDGLNLYSYCRNNPVKYYDPSGYFSLTSLLKCAKGDRQAGSKIPIKNNEVTTYQDFYNRSVVGDNLEGHELWQHANLKAIGLATYRKSTDASKQNIVIALEKELHKIINNMQKSLDAANQKPLENILSNAKILLEAGIPEDIVNDMLERAIVHMKNVLK